MAAGKKKNSKAKKTEAVEPPPAASASSGQEGEETAKTEAVSELPPPAASIAASSGQVAEETAASSLVVVVGAGLSGLCAAHAALQVPGSRVLLLEAERSLGGAGGRAEASRAVEGWPEDESTLGDLDCQAAKWLAATFGVSRGEGGMPPGVVALRRLTEELESEARKSERLQIVTGALVSKLLLAASGDCCGCIYSLRGCGEVSVHGVVILCCGGFAGDNSQDSLLAQHRPDLLRLPSALGAGSAAGAVGLNLAAKAGARLEGLGRICVHPTALVRPGEDQGLLRRRPLAARALRLAGGVLLSEAGERLCKELGADAEVACEIWKCSGPVRLVLDEGVTGEAEWHRARCEDLGFLRHYPSRAGLARDMGVPLPKLEKALGSRGRHVAGHEVLVPNGCAAGHEPSSSSSEVPAAEVSPGLWVALVSPAVYCCEGGLAARESDGAVQRGTGDAALPGLFAAGELVADTGSDKRSPLLRCVHSGRLAGTAAASAAAGGAGRDTTDCRVVEQDLCTPCTPISSQTLSETPTGTTDTDICAAMARRRFEKLLQSNLTAASLQNALATAHLADGDLLEASQQLVGQLLKSLNPVTIGSSDADVMVRMRDKGQGGALPSAHVRAQLPEATGSSEVEVSCVYCRLPLTLQLTCSGDKDAPRQPESQEKEGPFAYATLLYGSTAEYFLGALVLGWSLQANGCLADRLLLHTEDVPGPFLEGLEQFWNLRKVDYLKGSQTLYDDYDASRFKAVFTKLHALSCTDYAKILMMDNDMLVRGNLDELFNLRAPAALKRCSGQEQPPHGGDFFAEDLWRRERDGMFSGINAGVMLLQPDQVVYDRMIEEIQDDGHPEHIGTDGPEQNYLARWYTTFGRGAWSHVHAKFNYQPMLPDDYVGTAHREIDVLRDVMVAHYSGGRVKPWKFDGIEINVDGVRRFLEDDSLRGMLGQEARRGGRDRRPPRTTTRVMDGVSVVQNDSDSGLPENVQCIMWEWILALRECNAELLEAGVDLLTLMSEAEHVLGR